MKRALLLSLAFAGALGCAPEFEDQSVLTTLRVIAVRKDKPYAKPGDTVKLSMLLDDGTGADADAAPKNRDIQIGWFFGCENPLGDIYAGCFPELAKAFSHGAPEGGALGNPPGFGPEYSVRLSSDIISRRPPPVDNSPPYGLAYVFFFACAGHLDLAPAGQQFPIACFSSSGVQLGADDFVAGYTAIYAYDSIENRNPGVLGFEVDKKPVTPVCINDGCVTGAPPPAPREAGTEGGRASDASSEAGTEGGASEAGTVDAGAPKVDAGAPPEVDPCADPNAATCWEVCPETTEKKDCPEHDVKLITDTTVEPDAVAEARDPSRPLNEQGWINYYTERGEFTNDVKLLSDSTAGYNEDHGTKLRAPKKLGPFQVWGVAHDNRGGVGWVKVRLATRLPKK